MLLMHSKYQKLIALIKRYQLNDVRNIGLIIFAVMAAVVSWSGAKAIGQNFELQKKVIVLEEQNKLQQLQNDTQKLKNEYYKSDEYKELSARRLLGKAAPGERLYIVPKEVALKYVSPAPQVVQPTKTEEIQVKLPKYQQNIQDWLSFFFHRSPSV